MTNKNVDKKKSLDISIENLRKFQLDFSNETDRAFVIIAASRIDELLKLVILNYLMPPPSRNDELFDGDRPLSTFSAKISLAYRLGILGTDIIKSLNLIRKMRNSFAHEVSKLTLEDSPHRDRVTELENQAKKSILYMEKEKHSEKFREAVKVITFTLEVISQDISTIDRDGYNFQTFVRENSDKA